MSPALWQHCKFVYSIKAGLPVLCVLAGKLIGQLSTCKSYKYFQYVLCIWYLAIWHFILFQHCFDPFKDNFHHFSHIFCTFLNLVFWKKDNELFSFPFSEFSSLVVGNSPANHKNLLSMFS